MNRERRKEVAKVFFDLSKYLLTTVAVSSFLTESLNVGKIIIGLILAGAVMIVAYFVTPKDKN